VQSRVKALDKIEKIELPKKRRLVKFEFRPPPRSGEQVATLEGVTKAYGRRVVHGGLSLNVRRGERWAVILDTASDEVPATLSLATGLGMLASPKYGGNFRGSGWKMLGFVDQHAFAPPFGYYDREYTGFVPYS